MDLEKGKAEFEEITCRAIDVHGAVRSMISITLLTYLTKNIAKRSRR
jgi:hypothetical protein